MHATFFLSDQPSTSKKKAKFHKESATESKRNVREKPSSSSASFGDSSLIFPSFLEDPNWQLELSDLFKEEFFQKLDRDVAAAYEEGEIFPPQKLIFNAFNLTPFNDVSL